MLGRCAISSPTRRGSKPYAAENMAILRHIALNVLKNDSSKKRGIKGKQKNASWDHSYLLSLLGF